MSPLTLGMDGLLAVLLIAALGLGVRLNRRLSVLRESQEGFAKAVGELNAAAERADTGLKSLKAASEETHDALLTRIETARGLLLRLEKACDAAELAARRVETATPKGPVLAAPAEVSRPPLSAAARPAPAETAQRLRELSQRLRGDAERAEEEVLSLRPADQVRGGPRSGLGLRQALDALHEARSVRAAEAPAVPGTAARGSSFPAPEPRGSPRRRPLADEALFEDGGPRLKRVAGRAG